MSLPTSFGQSLENASSIFNTDSNGGGSQSLLLGSIGSGGSSSVKVTNSSSSGGGPLEKKGFTDIKKRFIITKTKREE